MAEERGQTVLEFCEHHRGPLPSKLTVRRSAIGKYLFLILVRHVRQKLNRRPTFLTYTKSSHMTARATIEEHPLMEQSQLYVLEGFSQNFVDSLRLPPGTHVAAETEGGELEPDPFGHYYATRRAILRTLLEQLRANLSLRELLKLDWSGLTCFDEFEPLLRKAKLMSWSEGVLGQQLVLSHPSRVLVAIKRGAARELADLVDRYGPQLMISTVTRGLGQLIHLNVLKETGALDERLLRELSISRSRFKDLEEAAMMLIPTDITAMAERLVAWDRVQLRNPTLATNILLLNAPIRIRRGYSV